ncbi:SPOR domain-containing protein, partial [Myxococcota bacterium]
MDPMTLDEAGSRTTAKRRYGWLALTAAGVTGLAVVAGYLAGGGKISPQLAAVGARKEPLVDLAAKYQSERALSGGPAKRMGSPPAPGKPQPERPEGSGPEPNGPKPSRPLVKTGSAASWVTPDARTTGASPSANQNGEAATAKTEADSPGETSHQARELEFASSDGAFYVQVASFEVKERADQRARALRDQGVSASSFAYGGPKAGWWHVVRIGPFQNRPEA